MWIAILLITVSGLLQHSMSMAKPTTTTTTSEQLSTSLDQPSLLFTNENNSISNSYSKNDNCPLGMFKCLLHSKSNNDLINKELDDLDSLSEQHWNSFYCIDKNRICDGQHDCPNGEDESSCDDESIHTADANTIIQSNPSGCYLCRNTTDQCISVMKLCDHHKDCPNGDDESVMCRKRQLSYESKFASNQYGATNINIVNRDSGNIQKSPNIEPLSFPNRNGQSQLLPLSTYNQDREKSSGPSVQDGVGFQFRVNNMVIYNSEVKMFNQDSDDVGSSSSSASPSNNNSHRNDTERYHHQHYHETFNDNDEEKQNKNRYNTID